MSASASFRELSQAVPEVAFISPFPRDGFGGAIWSAQIETALAASARVRVLRLVDDRGGPSSALRAMVRRARTYGLERRTVIRPWLRDQLASGCDHFILDSTNLGWVAQELRSLREGIRITVIVHNVEAQYLSRRDDLHGAVGWMHRCVLARCERAAARWADHLVFLTDYDRRLFRRLYQSRGSSSVVPIALDRADFARPIPETASSPKLLFVGSNYFGNRDAIRALSAILPRDARLEIVVAGRLTAPESAAPQLRFVGYVDNLAELYRGCTAALVPVRIGGGMKVKVAEALSYGVPVIASAASARGYEDAVAAGVVRVFRNAGQLLDIAQRWQQTPPQSELVRAVFDRSYSARNLPSALWQVLQR